MQTAGNVGAITLKDGSAKAKKVQLLPFDGDEYGAFAFVGPILLLNEAQCSERLSLAKRPMITPMVRTAAAQLVAATEAAIAQHEAESTDEALEAIQRCAATKKAVHQRNMRGALNRISHHPPGGAFLLPARVLLNGSELKGGSWHPAAVELSVAVRADLEFHRSQWYVPVGRTLHCYQDWAVAMAYHGAVYLTERHGERAEAIVACNKRSSNMQRRCSRVLVKYGLTTAVGSKSPAADLYYAAVAVLVEAGTVTKWVRRRDLRKGFYGAEKCAEPFRDPYWQLKLKCTCLWVPGDAADAATTRTRPTDPHSGLRLEHQLEVLVRSGSTR